MGAINNKLQRDHACLPQLSALTSLTSLSLQALCVDKLTVDFDMTHALPMFANLTNLRSFEHFPAAEPTYSRVFSRHKGLHHTKYYNMVMSKIGEALGQRGIVANVWGNMDRVELPATYNAEYEDLDMPSVVFEVSSLEALIDAVEIAAWTDVERLRAQLTVMGMARRLLYDIAFIDVNQMIAMGLMLGVDME